MGVSQGVATPIISRPTRLRLFTSALKYLAFKALTILVTIFVGVFLTMLIVNYPPGIGTEPNKSPFEVKLESEIEWMVKHTLYTGTIIVPGPVDYEAQAEILTDQLRAEVGLDLPFWPRNLLWTFKALSFNWGQLDLSFIQALGMGASVEADTVGNPVLHYFPNTLLLVGTSYLLVFLLGMPLALYLARNYGSRVDRLVTVLSPISSVPSWVFAILLIALFAVQLRWLPVGGMSDIFYRPKTPIENIITVAKHMVLPVTALVLSLLFQLVYAWRTFFIIYSEEDYVELARAQGLDHKILERQYILRPALPYIITSFTTSLIGFWQLTVALESVFRWPGIGLLYIESLPNYWGESVSIGDLMIVIQIVVTFAYLLGILVFILDVVYVLIDPRIHLVSNTLPRDKNARVKTRFAGLARFLSRAQRRGKVLSVAQQGKGPREKRIFSLSKALRAILESIRVSWGRSGLFFQELRRYPSAMFGLAIIVILLAGSLYAVLALPYEEFGRSYNEDRVSGFNLRPRVAAPNWFNLFSATPRLSTLIMDENNASVSTSTLDNGWTQETVTFTFQYPYDEMPSDVFLYLDPSYIEKFPFVSLIWKTPDGRVLNLKPIAVSNSINYDFKEGVQVPKFLNSNPSWKEWFVASGQYATPAYQLLFARPGAAQPTPQTGEYQLEVSSIFFEENSDLQPKLVLLGQVYGLAGTDFWRRDLVVPLFWGMPFVLFIGLLGTFITTLVALVLPAVGVWYGGWLDNFIQRLTEVNMVLPGLAIVVLTNLLFGVNVWIVLGVIVLLNAFGSPIKSFRSAFLQAKEAPYIEMARSYGASNFRIITRYLVPRILPVFIPQLVTQVPSFIFLEATLGFFNINSHYPSWGRIIYDGLTHGAIYGSPFWVLEPIFLLLLTGLAFAMLGSALERILNPRIISDISAEPEKIVTPRRKKLPIRTRRVFVSVILALLAFAFFVPTIQGKTLASFFLNLMDETRKLNTTITRPSAIPTRTPIPVTSTEVPASATEPLTTPTLPLTITPTSQASCIPDNRRTSARVLEIVDGTTVKVLMDGLVYVVRYIGVDAPQDEAHAMDAYLENSELVFQKDVTLIGDRMYKDAEGRLLRYVLVGDTFVNLQLLQNGLGRAVDGPPNSSCSEIFKEAEASAMQSALGIWAVPTPSP